jgi:hypothetical protein
LCSFMSPDREILPMDDRIRRMLLNGGDSVPRRGNRGRARDHLTARWIG